MWTNAVLLLVHHQTLAEDGFVVLASLSYDVMVAISFHSFS